MKKCLIANLLITLILFWTAEHRLGGSLEYDLLLKPYPSLLLFVGAGEEGAYNRAVRNGDFPDWLVNKQYLIVARGSLEEHTKIWEYARTAAISCVFLGWPLLLLWWLVRHLIVWRHANRLHLKKASGLF